MRLFKYHRKTGQLDISNGSSPDAAYSTSIESTDIIFARISRSILAK